MYYYYIFPHLDFFKILSANPLYHHVVVIIKHELALKFHVLALLTSKHFKKLH